MKSTKFVLSCCWIEDCECGGVFIRSRTDDSLWLSFCDRNLLFDFVKPGFAYDFYLRANSTPPGWSKFTLDLNNIIVAKGIVSYSQQICLEAQIKLGLKPGETHSFRISRTPRKMK